MQRRDLKKTIQFIKERLRNHESSYRKNETAVRVQIVDPILFSLGWDTRDPDQVRHEDATDEGRADYCLIKNKKGVLFIEAKNLSKNVEDNIKQLAKYTFDRGVDYGVITNGNKWLLLRSYERNKNLEDRKVWVVGIDSDKIQTVIRRLSCISKKNISSLRSIIRREEILSKNWEKLMNSPERLVMPISRVMQKQISGGNVSADETRNFVSMKLEKLSGKEFDYEKISDAGARSTEKRTRTRRKSPVRVQAAKKTAMITIRGQSIPINRSWEVLFHTANYLFNQGFLNKTDLPIQAGKKRFLVNKEPKHPSGKNFIRERKLDRGHYLEINYSTRDCIRLARNLLKTAGLSERDLKIKY